jgi:hypothetical protein
VCRHAWGDGAHCPGTARHAALNDNTVELLKTNWAREIHVFLRSVWRLSKKTPNTTPSTSSAFAEEGVRKKHFCFVFYRLNKTG